VNERMLKEIFEERGSVRYKYVLTRENFGVLSITHPATEPHIEGAH